MSRRITDRKLKRYSNDEMRQATIALNLNLDMARQATRRLTQLVGIEQGESKQYKRLTGLYGSLSGLADGFQAEFIGERPGPE